MARLPRGPVWQVLKRGIHLFELAGMVQDTAPADKARVQRHPYHVCILHTQCSRFRAAHELVQHSARSVGNPRAKAKRRVHVSIEAGRQLLDVYLPSHSRWRGWHVRLLRHVMRKPGAQVPSRHVAARNKRWRRAGARGGPSTKRELAKLLALYWEPSVLGPIDFNPGLRVRPWPKRRGRGCKGRKAVESLSRRVGDL
eukprot:scaffold89520_cov60-Phaeocystis_antarctica.AAC.4